jgi:hypothetical protein
MKFDQTSSPLIFPQVSSNLVAFEDANIKETRKGHDIWDMVDSVHHHDTLGDLLSPRAALSRTTRH